MSDILKQIQALQEQFSNLFEVDDLGQPAMDVPPSQNKIKKDVKTKDGKAELVSVEDELFPYDGNKREQYRQKILDTINGMIQGTSTLEDLLQIVRQKKAPLKEAMEVLEELTKEDEKATQKALDRHFDKVLYKPLKKQANITRKAIATEKYQKGNSEALKEAVELMEDLFSTILKQPEEKQGALVYKYHQGKNKENAGKDTYTQAKEEEKRKSKEEKGQEKTEQRKKYRGKSVEDWKLGRLMDQIVRNAKNLGKVEDSATAKAIRRNAQKAALKEALSLMEAIEKYIDNDGNTHELEFSANKNKYKFDHKINGKSVVSAVDSEPNANYERKHAIKNYGLKKVEEALEIMEAIINEVSDKTAQSALDAAQQRYHRKGYEASMKLFRGDSKGAIEDGNKARDEYNKHLNLQLKRAKRLGKKLVQDKNDHDSFKIEEALSLMEAIINEVSERTKIDAYKKRANQSKFIGDIAKGTAKWHMNRGAYGPAIEVLKKADAAQKKEFKHRLRTMLHDKAFGQDAYNKAEKELRDEWKAKEDIKEALEIMEAIINEVSIGKWKEAAASSLPKRKEEAEAAKAAAEKGWEEYDKVSREHPEDEPALYRLAQANDEEAAKAEDKEDHAYAVTRLQTHNKANANKAIKAAKKVQDKREDEFGRNPEKRTFLRSGKANQLAAADPVKSRADEALEEALAIINEVSKKFIAPRLEAGAEKAEQIAKRKEEIIADPKRTEKEKDEAAKESAAYQCKAINVTNDTVKYEEKKQKKNK